MILIFICQVKHTANIYNLIIYTRKVQGWYITQQAEDSLNYITEYFIID